MLFKKAPPKQPFHFDSGYLDAERWYIWITHRLLALLLLLLSLPFFIIIPLLIKLQDRGPIFYSGIRLGQYKQTFMMYKFRTLVPDAESIIGANLLNVNHRLETPLGKFLRETRLDEIPQLWNVLRGDMALIGPRPERPAIYEAICSNIKGYEKRFHIKPGLIGYSQLFTPHSTPKKVRALIDNHYMHARHHVLSDTALFFYAIFILSVRLCVTTYRFAIDRFQVLIKHRSFLDSRRYRRIAHQKTYVYLYSDASNKHKPLYQAQLKDINDRDLALTIGAPLKGHFFHIKMVTRYCFLLGRKSRFKCVHCDVELVSGRECNKGIAPYYVYVLRMQPLSQLNLLKLHKYFLQKSIL